MPRCINCQTEYDSSADNSTRNSRGLCNGCRSAETVEPFTESRQASVVTKQVWIFSNVSGLEQRTLSKRASSLRVGKRWVRRWYVGPKGDSLPRALIYAADAPSAKVVQQVALEATTRFQGEPWMS
jgi:hypothetical protein